MGRFVFAVIALCALPVLCATHAQASVLLTDNFSYNNQAAFEAVWKPSAGSSGVLLTGQALVGASQVGQRSEKSFSEFMPTADQDLEIRFRIQVASTPGQGRQYIDLMGGDGSGSGQLLELGTNNIVPSNEWFVRMGGSTEADSFVPMDAAAPDRAVAQWADLRAVIHRETETTGSAKVYVNNVLGKSLSGFTLDSYDTVRIGSNVASDALVFFDDVVVQTVPAPEPWTLGFVGAIAGVGVLSRRRAR